MSKSKQQQALRQAVEEELRVHYTDPKQLKQRLAQCSQGMLDDVLKNNLRGVRSNRMGAGSANGSGVAAYCCCYCRG
jgi:hypothetical protein